MTTGIEVRHRKGCPGPRADGKCCRPSYRAHAYDAASRKLIRRTFPTKTAARQWRQDAQVAIRRGKLRAPTALTVERAFADWLEAAERGEVRNRSGDRYKPSALRSYSQVMALRVTPRIGAVRFSSVRRRDLQDLVDALVGEGLAPATVMTAILPLRAVYGRSVARGDLDVNPTSGLRLPAVRGRRDRIADPGEAAQLLAAVPEGRDRTVWATAMYAGLRRGELIALRWEDVDLDAGVIRVHRGWDRQAGEVTPKSREGRRAVPIAGVLRRQLEAWRVGPVAPDARVFDVDGRPLGRPLEPGGLQLRADAAWKAAGLQRITLHECRHTFASLMIAAGVNAKALSTYLGHANIAITFDRYGHLMPGNEAEAAGLLDAYLASADTDRVWGLGDRLLGRRADPHVAGTPKAT